MLLTLSGPSLLQSYDINIAYFVSYFGAALNPKERKRKMAVGGVVAQSISQLVNFVVLVQMLDTCILKSDTCPVRWLYTRSFQAKKLKTKASNVRQLCISACPVLLQNKYAHATLGIPSFSPGSQSKQKQRVQPRQAHAEVAFAQTRYPRVCVCVCVSMFVCEATDMSICFIRV